MKKPSPIRDFMFDVLATAAILFVAILVFARAVGAAELDANEPTHSIGVTAEVRVKDAAALAAATEKVLRDKDGLSASQAAAYIRPNGELDVILCLSYLIRDKLHVETDGFIMLSSTFSLEVPSKPTSPNASPE